MMKNLGMLLPVGACALAAVWLSWNQREIVRLERENEVLGERIAAATRLDDRPLAPDADTGRPGAKDSGPIAWEELGASMLEARQGGTPDLRAMMGLQRRLMAMDSEELDAAIAELDALDLSEDMHRVLESMVLGVLAQRDPELVFERFSPELAEPISGISGQLAHAFRQWLGKEPQAAIAWFDERLAAGDFDSRSLDGRSASRLQFEAALLPTLLESDPAAAAARLAALPEDQRAAIVDFGVVIELTPGTEKAFAELVREQVPEYAQERAFCGTTGFLVHEGGYERVSEFLAAIDATPGERRAVAAESAATQLRIAGVGGGVDREAVSEMHDWLAREVPEEAGSVTGQALGNLLGEGFEERARLVEEFHAENGGDDVLVGFLRGRAAGQHQETSLRLAGMIEDEAHRAEELERLGAGADGERATEP